jgi:hypothetical protein
MAAGFKPLISGLVECFIAVLPLSVIKMDLIVTLGITTISIMTLIIMTLDKTTISIMSLGIKTLSIWYSSYVKQENDTA